MMPRHFRYAVTRSLLLWLAAVALFMLVVTSAAAQALDPLKEYRYTAAPARDDQGNLVRRLDVLRAYRKVHPCPSTGKFTGACPGWKLNHVMPLACGGVDAVYNLAFVRSDVKERIDAYEQRISSATPPIPDTPSCRFRVIPY